MTTNSGEKGFCKNQACLHPNNEHSRPKCRVQGCRKKWKICQVHAPYMICESCEDHIGGGPDGSQPDNFWMQGKSGDVGMSA